MSDKPVYDYILCESPTNAEPFAPLVKIGDLSKAKNRSFNPVRNRAGSASFTLRTNDDLIPEIFDSMDLNDIRGTIKKCIRIRRNKVDLWSGPIWGIQGSLASGVVTFNCVGWLETAQNRVLWNNLTNLDYSNGGLGTPGDQVAFGLINTVNADDPAHPHRIKPGKVVGTMQNRNRYYRWGQTILGPAIQELSDIEAGFDYEVDPVSRAVNLYSWDSYPDRTDIKLGMNWGPKNLKDVSWQEDASKTVNFMGVQSLSAVPVFAEDPTSMDEFGRFDEFDQLNEARQGILEPYAVAELVIRSRPIVTYTLTPNARMGTQGPTLFDDFQIGDRILWNAKKDKFVIKDQSIRVFGASISIDEEENETVTALQTTPATG